MKLKVMTYNICSGHNYEKVYLDTANDVWGEYDLSKCTKVIADIAPDICGLNEVDNNRERSGFDLQTEYIGKHTGMLGFFAKAISDPVLPNGAYGNAVLSRFPMTEQKVVSIPDPKWRDEDASYESRSVTCVKIDVDGTVITVLQTHFGLAISEQQNAQQTILKLLDTIDGPVILMGDFNIRPNNFLLNPIRDRLQDTAVLFDGYVKTFPSYPCKYPDCKIDYVFVSRHFKLHSAQIVQTRASDHMPYVVEVEI